MFNLATSRFFRVLSVSLLLIVGMPLVGCDQVGQNEEEEEQEDETGVLEDVSSDVSSELEKRANTTRYVAGTDAGRGAPPDGFGLYIEEGGDDDATSVLHTCIDVDDDNKVEHVREEAELENAQINDSGNLIETIKITKAEGAIYASGDEGEELEIKTFDFDEDGGYIQKIISSTQSEGPLNDEDNFDYFESTNGVPTDDEECRDREEFLSSIDNPPSRSDLKGTWRLNSSGNLSETSPNFTVEKNDKIALFFDIKSNETILHSCQDTDSDGQFDEYIREKSSVVSGEGGTVGRYSFVKEEIVKDENFVFDDAENNEGETNKVAYLSVQDETALQWVLSSSAENGGNVDGLEKTSGVPINLSQCQNKDRFIQ